MMKFELNKEYLDGYGNILIVINIDETNPIYPITARNSNGITGTYTLDGIYNIENDDVNDNWNLIK